MRAAIEFLAYAGAIFGVLLVACAFVFALMIFCNVENVYWDDEPPKE